MRQMITSVSPIDRIVAFFKEFEAAPNDVDIDIHIGEAEDGEAAIIVILGGSGHAFTTKEARAMARIAEDAIRAYPNDPRSNELPNLIMALRMGADKSDAARERALISGEGR